MKNGKTERTAKLKEKNPNGKVLDQIPSTNLKRRTKKQMKRRMKDQKHHKMAEPQALEVLPPKRATTRW